MQNYPIALDAANSARTLNVYGDGFWYESGEVDTAAQNLVVNGGFDDGLNTWNQSYSGYTVIAGKLRITSTDGNVFKQFAVTPGRKYRVSAKVKTTKLGSSSFKLFDGSIGSSGEVIMFAPSAVNVEESFEGEWKAQTSNFWVSCRTYQYSLDAGQTYLGEFDDVVVEEIKTSDTRIIVTPSGGSPIVLKPGQHFRLTEKCGTWSIASFDGTSRIAANVIIGAGDFGDSNISNTVKLDATFANVVKVANDPANPVPVAVAGGGNMPVQITGQTGNVNVQENLIAYTGSYTSDAVPTANTPVHIVTPPSNLNGITIHSAILEVPGASGASAFLAKSSGPGGATDGDVILFVRGNGTGGGNIVELRNKIKIPPGKGLYFVSSVEANAVRAINFTVH